MCCLSAIFSDFLNVITAFAQCFFCNFAADMLELNDVLLRGEQWTLSMMARDRQMTCLVGSSRWLYAMLGFEPVVSGFISVDGEPLTPRTVGALRRLMAFAPQCLDAVGTVTIYEPPTVQDVFSLKANRHLPISNGLLSEEMKRTGAVGDQARLLAVAVLLRRSILLVDHPCASSIAYLRAQAREGSTVIVVSSDPEIINAADHVVEMAC